MDKVDSRPGNVKLREKLVRKNVSANSGLLSLLKPYMNMVIWLIVFALLANGINLFLPKITSHGIDAYIRHSLSLSGIGWQFGIASFLIFLFTALQSIAQTYLSERVALDLRAKLSNKISQQNYLFIQTTTPAKLLTNLTSDIDSVKLFISQAIVSIVSSLVIIIGASILLLTINWRLALAVMLIIPLIGGTFGFVLGKVRALFLQSREVIDWLNKVINESILGAALIRVLNSASQEDTKFTAANTKAKDLGLKILNLFAFMIPAITFFANFATLIILVLGGHFVIQGTMTLGNFAAFNSYLAMLIFPIIIIGFMSNVIAQATASYQRIAVILNTADPVPDGTLKAALTGEIKISGVSLNYGEKAALKDIDLEIQPGTKTAIIGPTAAGKTQLLYLLTGLTKPDSGEITFDGQSINDYDPENLHRQIGFVFQDSILFNMTVRENIAFSTAVTEADLQKAIDTAELHDFIDALPEGLETIVSERGTSLSGGQKQRIMLARALALNPRILLLDDFTARVDNQTEQKILANIERNYPDITLLSITQKIAAIEHYQQIVVLMEGEILGRGTHTYLMENSPEYVQIYNSQRSTSSYEVQS